MDATITTPVAFTRTQLAIAAGLTTLRQLSLIETLGIAAKPLTLDEVCLPLRTSSASMRSMLVDLGGNKGLVQTNLARGIGGALTTVELTERGRRLIALLNRAKPTA